MIGELVEGVTEALNRAAVDLAASDEPEWLRARRTAAWDVYERTPMPTTRLEQWRYTDLTKTLDLDAMTLSAAETAPDEMGEWPVPLREAIALDRDDASGRIVFIDGHVVHTDVDADLAAKGVVLLSLHKAVHERPDLLEEYLATKAVPAEEGKFAALNAALWTDGVLLHVPHGVHLERPVRVTRWFSESGVATFSRTLIVAESASHVSYVDEMLSDAFDARSLVSVAVEVVAGDGAQVQYVSIQRLGANAFYQSVQRTLAQRDAKLDTLNVALGGSVSRVDLNARLLGPGADSDMLGLYFGDGDQHFDFNTSQDHIAPEATSDLLYKGALDESSRAVFRGIIRVHKGAQKTDAYQTNRNLLLSPHARADSLPNLEIEADDVKCSHGASVGELDADAKFYLMTRGLTRTMSERLVVLGFLGEVLSRLPMGGVGKKVQHVIERKLRGLA